MGIAFIVKKKREFFPPNLKVDHTKPVIFKLSRTEVSNVVVSEAH